MFLSRNGKIALKLNQKLGLIVYPVCCKTGLPAFPNWKPNPIQDSKEIKRLWKMQPKAIPVPLGQRNSEKVTFDALANVTKVILGKGNLTTQVTNWIENASECFHIRDCIISNRKKDQAKIRVIFGRLVKQGLIQRVPHKRGYYKKCNI
ncbi:MAG: hypothetical protein JRF25_10860 [Deltaproteobacteria bacterium]|nr:hypothetical protein [Deltaproteobacteria bacterium]